MNFAWCEWKREGFVKKKSIIQTMMPILEELDYYVWLLTCLILSLRMFYFPYASFVGYTINTSNFRVPHKSTIE